MDSLKAISLCRDLLAVLTLRTPTVREGWLAPFLCSVRDAAGATVASLGESAECGWVVHGYGAGKLERKELRRLFGLTRRLVLQGGSVLEPEIRRGSLFRDRYEGWPGIKAAGMAAIMVSAPPPRRVWLSLLRSPEDSRFGADTLGVLDLAATAMSTALHNEARTLELERLADTDGLTHIPNYRFIRQAIDAEIARALRLEEYFTVVMVDVDNLKAYNAAHGHLGGSDVLRDLARLLQMSIRRTDLVAKYGGDEFLLLLPRTRPDGGTVLSERVRRRVAENLRGLGGEALSCSFGVAGFPTDGCDFESLVRAADRALFQAKIEGRNAVVCLASDLDAREREAA
jgi:two-component system, cell cycle response regulator